MVDSRVLIDSAQPVRNVQPPFSDHHKLLASNIAECRPRWDRSRRCALYIPRLGPRAGRSARSCSCCCSVACRRLSRIGLAICCNAGCMSAIA